MRAILPTLAVAYLLFGTACAQHWATVSASNITDLHQNKLAAGQLCFLGTDRNDNLIRFSIGDGGRSRRHVYCSRVTAGALMAFRVPNPENTTPAGIHYRVTVKDSTGKEVLRYAKVTLAGGTFDFDTYAPIDPRNLTPFRQTTVLGNVTVKGNIVATGTVSGSNILSGVPLADKQAGPNAGAKITACIAALPATGGICDARGFGATMQTISSQLDIGGSGKAVTLLINPATQFQCTENAPSNYCVRVWPGSAIVGYGTQGTVVSPFANFTAVSGSNLKGVIGNWPRDGTSLEPVSIQNITLRSSTGSTISEGLLSLSGIFSGTYVQNVLTVYCGGGGAALYITNPSVSVGTSDLTFVNDNFDCQSASGSGHAIEIVGTGGASPGSINFYGVQAQHSALSEVDINGNGTIQCSSILFSGLHTESGTALGTTPPHITVNDCHNVTLEHWNTSGPTPTSGNLVSIAQATDHSTHDIYIRDGRFLSGTKVVSSTVSGISTLPFVAQPDGAMSVEYWPGLPLAPANFNAVMPFQHGCQGTAAANTTIHLNTWQTGAFSCTDISGRGRSVMTSPGTIKNLACNAITGGAKGSSGVVTVMKNQVVQSVTCTFGTGISCTDANHSFSVVRGDTLSFSVETQPAETLADIVCGVEKQ